MAQPMSMQTVHNKLTGEEATLTRTNAWDVVENRNDGWAYGALKAAAPSKNAVEEVPAEEAPEAPQQEDVPAPSPADIEPAGPEDLNRDELLELCLGRGLEVDRRWGVAKLRAALEAPTEE